MRTLGTRIYRIRPIHGFSAQVSATSVIFGAALLGGPVSSTQVLGSSVIGAGTAERPSKVRWGIALHILVAWVITIPTSAILGAAILRLFWIAGEGVV